MNQNIIIEVQNLTKTFPHSDGGFLHAVNDVSFTVQKGEVYGIIGLSGGGKSTLVRCINRLQKPTSGKIYIDGQDITAMTEKQLQLMRREVGMIFQSFNLFKQMTVLQNIAFPLHLWKVPQKEINERSRELLQFVGLEDKANSYPSELSGGQRQRVGIARALALQPKILLSDEGTSALDPENTQAIVELLRASVREFDMTLLLITHQMEVAKSICDRIAVMEDGKIIEENTTEALFRSPKTERTKNFIAGLSDEPSLILPDLDKRVGTVVRLSFSEDTYDKPILSRLIRQHNMDINILSGNVNALATTRTGYLIVEILGSDDDLKIALSTLEAEGIETEVLA